MDQNNNPFNPNVPPFQQTPNYGQQNAFNPLLVTEQIKGYLLEIAKWAKFLSIIGFIGLALMVLGALGLFVAGGSSYYGAKQMTGMGVVYLIAAGLYYFPVFYLFKSASELKTGCLSNDQMTLTNGFENLKSHYKFVGISMIIVLSLYALIFVGGLLFFAAR
jgi:Family of unknown function (DUF5362)